MSRFRLAASVIYLSRTPKFLADGHSWSFRPSVPHPEGKITFRGRDHGIVKDRKLVLIVCPLCSQRNAPATAAKGYCQWCAYVPSLADAQPRRKD